MSFGETNLVSVHAHAGAGSDPSGARQRAKIESLAADPFGDNISVSAARADGPEGALPASTGNGPRLGSGR